MWCNCLVSLLARFYLTACLHAHHLCCPRASSSIPLLSQSSSVDVQFAISDTFYVGNYTACQQLGVWTQDDPNNSYGDWIDPGQKWTIEILPNMYNPPANGLALKVGSRLIFFFFVNVNNHSNTTLQTHS